MQNTVTEIYKVDVLMSNVFECLWFVFTLFEEYCLFSPYIYFLCGIIFRI